MALNRLWLDMQVDEVKDKMASDTYKQMSDSLSQIVYLNKSLVDTAYPSLKTGFESFMRRELGKLNEVKSHFNNLSSSLSEALLKKAVINKNKFQVILENYDFNSFYIWFKLLNIWFNSLGWDAQGEVVRKFFILPRHDFVF